MLYYDRSRFPTKNCQMMSLVAEVRSPVMPEGRPRRHTCRCEWDIPPGQRMASLRFCRQRSREILCTEEQPIAVRYISPRQTRGHAIFHRNCCRHSTRRLLISYSSNTGQNNLRRRRYKTLTKYRGCTGFQSLQLLRTHEKILLRMKPPANLWISEDPCSSYLYVNYRNILNFCFHRQYLYWPQNWQIYSQGKLRSAT